MTTPLFLILRYIFDRINVYAYLRMFFLFLSIICHPFNRRNDQTRTTDVLTLEYSHERLGSRQIFRFFSLSTAIKKSYKVQSSTCQPRGHGQTRDDRHFFSGLFDQQRIKVRTLINRELQIWTCSKTPAVAPFPLGQAGGWESKKLSSKNRINRTKVIPNLKGPRKKWLANGLDGDLVGWPLEQN